MKGKKYIPFSQSHPTFYHVGKLTSAVEACDALTQRQVSIPSVI